MYGYILSAECTDIRQLGYDPLFTPTAPLHRPVITMDVSTVGLFSDLLVVYHLIGKALFVMLDRL